MLDPIFYPLYGLMGVATLIEGVVLWWRDCPRPAVAAFLLVLLKGYLTVRLLWLLGGPYEVPYLRLIVSIAAMSLAVDWLAALPMVGAGSRWWQAFLTSFWVNLALLPILALLFQVVAGLIML